MNLSDSPSALKQIRKASWKFEQTFKTPLNNLQPYVVAILSAASPETACVTIEEAVFEPKHWIDLLTRYSLPPRYSKGVSVTAIGAQEMQELLYTAFTDWFDFLFVPTPKPFVIYADHDFLCQHPLESKSCRGGSRSARIRGGCRVQASALGPCYGQLSQNPHSAFRPRQRRREGAKW